jgi:hypothetical protein
MTTQSNILNISLSVKNICTSYISPDLHAVFGLVTFTLNSLQIIKYFKINMHFKIIIKYAQKY